MAQQTLNYVDYDFDTLVSQLQNRLALTQAWKDIYKSATGEMLIELFAAVGTLVLYYVERRAEESYIGTAQNYSSLVNLSRLIGYTPTRNISSTGTLQFTLSAPAVNPVFIISFKSTNPVVCSTSSGVNFLAATDAVILAGQTSVTVGGIQGEVINITQTSTGVINQEFNVKDTLVENSNVYVYVNNIQWNQVTSFINSNNTSTDFTLRAELDGTVTVIFGDNVFGLAPSIGDIIIIKYIQSVGLTGNVYSIGDINVITSTIYDSLTVVQSVTVTNTTNFLGGQDAETTEDIRENAPKVFATGDRLVTKSDFIAVINNYPSVADSNVWGENEENPPNYTMFNQVKIVAILQNWILPDVTFESTLSTFLYTKSLLTVRYSFVPPVILNIVPTLSIYVIPGASISYVQSLIETAIANQFLLGSTAKLGISVRQSDIIQIVNAVSGVAYCYITLKISKILLSTYNSAYNWSETMDALPLLHGGVQIYINNTLIATDNGVGGYTNASSLHSVTGLVNYTTGFVGANISPAPSVGATVYCRYQQDASGDVVVTKEQICKLYFDDYTVITYSS